METSQDSALEYIIKIEGGFVNLPKDKGGPTNMGITQKTLSDFLFRQATIEDVKYLTKELAKEIYREFYWNKMKLSEIESPMTRLCLFDQCVHRGPRSATRQAQEVCNEYFKGKLIIDGIMGIKTIIVINSINGEAFSQDYLNKSFDFYRKLVDRDPTQKIFLAGWLNRLKNLSDHIFTDDEYSSQS